MDTPSLYGLLLHETVNDLFSIDSKTSTDLVATRPRYGLGANLYWRYNRLTDSGLSITEWEVVSGVLPPLNATQWDEAFSAYKVAASRQHEVLHATMSLAEFKWIYFWEYFHRLWARCMGLVFIIPFIWFLIKGWIPGWLSRRLGWVILLAAAQATMGWIMVKVDLMMTQEHGSVRKVGLSSIACDHFARHSLQYLSPCTIRKSTQGLWAHEERQGLLLKRRTIIDANCLRWIYGRYACGADS